MLGEGCPRGRDPGDRRAGRTKSRAGHGGMESSVPARLDEKVRISYSAKRTSTSAKRHIFAKRGGTMIAPARSVRTAPISFRVSPVDKGRCERKPG
jgi:hypothetical protein